MDMRTAGALMLFGLMGCGGVEVFSLTDTPVPNRMFVTARTFAPYELDYTGEKPCQAAADEAKLGGHWQAWLSSHEIFPIHAKDTIVRHGPWYDLAGAQIFSSRAALISGRPETGIAVNERGERLPDGEPIWTGTKSDGTASVDRCFSQLPYRIWYADTGAVQGLVGETGALDARWTEAYPLLCNQRAHLICFER